MKKRIDILVSEKFNMTRSKAQQVIERGFVKIEVEIVTKSSMLIEENVNIALLEREQYVSRGAYKLLKGLKFFNVSLKDKVVLDMGASTGGFCQVALENGAKKVYAVDVGQNVLDESLKNNPRVVSYENKDVRTIQKEEVEGCNFITGDLSFISLKLVLPSINTILQDTEMILLFKPQFECGAKIAKKYKGVIKDKLVHINLLKEFVSFLKEMKIKVCNLTFSPIKGKSGNIEYLFYLNGKNEEDFDITKVVEEAFKIK